MYRLTLPRRRGTQLSRDDAEAIAATALAFLAAEAARLDRFMRETGLTVSELRAGAGGDAMACAVLEHLCSDELLLLTFCSNHRVEPAVVAPALRLLAAAAPA